MEEVSEKDPASGRWNVDGTEATLWVDVSSLAKGEVLEVNGEVVEDACWFRPTDGSQTNMAELDALARGMNTALTWNMRHLHLRTDSLTVYRWVSDTLFGKVHLKTKAANEMLIWRRLGIIKSLVTSLTLTYVCCCLTRVPQQWLRMVASQGAPLCATAILNSLESARRDIREQ